MNTRRLLLIAGVLVAAAALAGVILLTQRAIPQPTPDNWMKLAEGVRKYSQSLAVSGRPLPLSVTLRELVDGGFVSGDDARAFADMEVTVFPRARTNDSRSTLIHVKLPGGDEMALMADGSVRQLTK
jgi:hypothetical protein